MMEEAHPVAAAILRDAGWKPHDSWGVYTKGTLVMGFSPDGAHFDVKNWGADIHGPDTPDDPVEAAQWLVRLREVKSTLTTPATLETPQMLGAEAPCGVAPVSEEGESLGDESNGEAGEATNGGTLAEGLDPASVGDDENPELFASEPGSGELDPGGDGDFSERVLDAEFDVADLGQEDELAEVEASDTFAELPAPEPEDFAPDELDAAPESDQARFYGLDDLDRVKRLRIGDVAAEAAVRIAAVEAEVGEREGEYQTVQAFVVSNLDKFTGAFTLQDAASQATAHRFYALEDAKRRVSAIDMRRKEATAWLLHEDRTRDDVVNFSVEAAFA